MGRIFGRYGPAHPRLARASRYLTVPVYRMLSARRRFHTPGSAYAAERGDALHQKLLAGEPAYLLGIGPGTHNAGIALVEVSRTAGVRLLGNHEEERFNAVKHYAGYPELAVETVRTQIAALGLRPSDIHACLASFDFVEVASPAPALEEAPASLGLLVREPERPELAKGDLNDILFATPGRLGRQLGLGRPMPIIGMGHHDNHAYFSYAASPFAADDEPAIVAVLDGTGDNEAISFYLARAGRLRLLWRNDSIYDSLGLLYGFISSTQGGWTMFSSEGRYMGAAAWGNNDRLTNPYYMRLRQLMYFDGGGRFALNRALANWPRDEFRTPYTDELIDILGPPILPKDMWNPDAVLNVEQVEHADITRDRLDKAAATQLLFEDVLCHSVGALIRQTGSRRLVLTGGCALNCIANMRLLDHFGPDYYERYLGRKDARLHLWVPPTPSDTGVTMGAAFAFAMQNGGRPGAPLRHAFYCGLPPSSPEILAAIDAEAEIEALELGSASERGERERIADFLAYVIAADGIVGLFQGAAETGPRALGHRSILANPANPRTRERLNGHVKFRELIRPLAPMATLEAAQRWFELSPGAGDDGYNAYNYMILTARARPEAYPAIPAVIHHDGTSRVQIVREESDPFTHAYLKALGRRIGAEVSVNTSLNVGSPIAQTPAQALEALKRSKGMHALLMIGDDGRAFLAWHHVHGPLKDAGRQLRMWRQQWDEQRS